MRRGACIAIVALVACHDAPPKPSAQHVMDQCNLDGAAANHDPDSVGLATTLYLITCMRANGWVMRTDQPCAGDPHSENGLATDFPLWHDSSCYRPIEARNSN